MIAMIIGLLYATVEYMKLVTPTKALGFAARNNTADIRSLC
jgi:hypothetical protein